MIDAKDVPVRSFLYHPWEGFENNNEIQPITCFVR